MQKLLQKLSQQTVQQSPEASVSNNFRKPAVVQDQIDPELAELAAAIQGEAVQEQQAPAPTLQPSLPNDRFSKIKAMFGK